MRLFDAILDANRRQGAGDPGARVPVVECGAGLPVAALTCIDARLNHLLPDRLGLPEEQFIWLRNAGNIITGPLSSTMRSLALACAVKGAKEIAVIGHTDCLVGKTTAQQLLDRLARIFHTLLGFLRAFGDVWAAGFRTRAGHAGLKQNRQAVLPLARIHRRLRLPDVSPNTLWLRGRARYEISGLAALGVDRPRLPDNLVEYFGLFASERQNVMRAADFIRASPLIGAKVPVHGLVIDVRSGQLEWVVNGYQNFATAEPGPVGALFQQAEHTLDAFARIGHLAAKELHLPETKIGESVGATRDWMHRAEQIVAAVAPALGAAAPKLPGRPKPAERQPQE